MAYLVRCPFSLCGRVKRIDPETTVLAGHALPRAHRCPDCGVRFYATPPELPGHLGAAYEDWG